MGFSDLKSNAGIAGLNEFLSDKSYIDGYVPTQADVAVFEALSCAPGADLANVLRWYNHIKSYSTGEQSSFPGEKKSADEYGPRGAEQAKKEDDDFDMFSDSEEDDETEEEKRIKKERLAAYLAKKSGKKAVIAKSTLIIDVKPWDDETGKFVAVGYGIKKLQISAVIEDAKILTDWLEEEITSLAECVQSMDIVAFNKL